MVIVLLSSIDFDERSSSEGFVEPLEGFVEPLEGFVEPLENRRFSDQAAQNLDSTPRISKLHKGNPVLNTSTDDLGFTAPPVPVKPPQSPIITVPLAPPVPEPLPIVEPPSPPPPEYGIGFEAI